MLDTGRLSDEQRAVAELAGALADDLTARASGADSVADAARTLDEQGLLKVAVAESQGGGDADLGTAVLCWTAFAARWPALALASVHVHAAALLAAGDESEAILGRLPRVALAQFAGADLRVSRGVDSWRLDGGLARLDAATTDPVVLLCPAAPDHEGALVLDCAEPVFDLEPVEVTGLRGGRTFTLRVLEGGAPVRTLQAAEGGLGRAVSILGLGVSSICVGAARAALEATRRYTAERIQFGAPLAAIPAVSAQLESMAILLQRDERSLLSLAADGPSLVPGDARRTLRVCVDDAVAIARAAIQLHGGYGYLTEYPVAQLYRDAISLRAVAHSIGIAS